MLLVINVTGSNVTGYLSGIAQTAGFASTSFGLTGTPEITVGNIVGSSATVTALVVDNKIGVGSDTPAADIEVRKTSNAAVDVITSLSTARISVGQSVGTGNSSGVLSFNSGTLSSLIMTLVVLTSISIPDLVLERQKVSRFVMTTIPSSRPHMMVRLV